MNSRLRKQALREWRGYAEPTVPPDRSKGLGEVVKSLMHKLGLRETLQQEEVRALWLEIVGEFLASHSTPDALRHGVLYIRVIQPTVRYELERTWKREILRKLQDRFGARVIREVRFVLG